MGVNTTRRNVLIAAAILGLITSMFTYKFLQDAKVKNAQTPIEVVVAIQDIPPRTIIDASMVSIKQLPGGEVPANAFTKITDILGKVSLVQLSKDAAIALENVEAKGLSLGLAYVIPSSMRAVTVGVTQITGVAGFPKPGDHVDVVATFKRNNTSVAKTVLQNVELLALGSRLQEERVKEDGRKTDENETATLLVTPNQAEQLALAEDQGKLRLILRAAGDHSLVNGGGASMSTGAAAPASQPRVNVTPQRRNYEPRPVSWTPPIQLPAPQAVPVTTIVDKRPEVEVIRGTEIDKVKVVEHKN